MVEGFKREITELAELLAELDKGDTLARIEEASRLITDSMRSGGKLLACGNGGSAAVAQHLVAELVVRFRREREALPAVSLSVDPSVVTACANDMGYAMVFARQVAALGKKGDVLLAMTTSGRSENIAKAVEAARERGLRVIYLCGADVPRVEADVIISVPSVKPPRVQELHTLIIHLLAGAVEEGFAG